MASSSPKQLREHLREQQEPFILHIYILERIRSSHPKRGCKCNMNNRNFYTKNILELILCKFIRLKCSLQDLNCHKVQKHNLISKMTGRLRRIGETKRCSDIGSSVAYHDLSICGIKDSPNHEKLSLHLWRNSQNNKHSSSIEKEVATETNKLGKYEENMQLKPRSVLDEAPASSIGFQFQFPARGEEEDASSSSTIFTENATEDSISSAFLLETKKLNQAEFMQLNGIVSPGFLKLSENKSILQHSEQLLFDGINKATETHERKKNYENCTQGSPGLVELEKICSWRNQKPTQKINFDVSNVIEDWNDMQQAVKRKIVIEIGDVIIGEMMQDVLNLFFV